MYVRKVKWIVLANTVQHYSCSSAKFYGNLWTNFKVKQKNCLAYFIVDTV